MSAAAQRLIILCACTTFIGCRNSDSGPYPRVDPDDLSVELEKPFHTTTGKINQNGTAFDRAEIDLAGADVLWAPEDGNPEVTVQPTGEPGRVVIDLEKRWHDGSHTVEGSDVRQTRRRVEVRAARVAGAVVVSVSRGWSHRHGGMTVIANFRVPPGVRVERGEPPRADGAALAWEVVPQTPVPVAQAKR